VIESLRKLFNTYDRDQNGVLDLSEMKKLFGRMSISGAEAEQLFQQIDLNHDSFISFEELCSALEAVQQDGVGIWKLLKLGLFFSSNFTASPKNVEAIEELKEKAQQQGRTVKIVSFIRHGESEANYLNSIQGNAKGCWDPHITQRGVEQSKKRAELLKENPNLYSFDLIVMSPLTRSVETCIVVLADYLGKVPAIAHPLAVEQLTECDDVGKPPAVIKELWKEYPIDFSLLPDKPEVWWYPGPKALIPNPELETLESQQEKYLSEEGGWSEPWELVLERAQQFELWLKNRPEQHICVVSHGGFIEALVGKSLNNAGQAILEV